MKERKKIAPTKHSLFADFINLFSGKIAHMIITISIGIATARIWGADGRGLIAVVMIWPLLICRFFEQGSMRSLPYQIGKGVLPIENAGRVLFILWSITSILAVGITLTALLFIIEEDLAWPWLLAVGLLIPSELINSYSKGFALGAQKPRLLTNLTLITGPITLAAILIGGGALGNSLQTDAWIYIAARALGLIAAGIVALRLVVTFTSLGVATDIKQLWKTFVATIHFGTSGMIMQLNYYADVLLLSLPFFLIPKGDIGNYTVGIAAAGMLWLIPQALGMLMLSRGALAEDPERYNRQVASTARGSIIVAAPIMVLIFLICPYAFPIVYGAEFDKAGSIVQILSPSILAFFGARIYESGFNARGISTPITIIMGATAALNILLNILLIPEHGVYGAAWASAVTYPLGTLALGIAFAKSSGIGIIDMFRPRMSDINPVLNRVSRFLPSKRTKNETPSE